jgi:hypothetical protein
VSEPRYRADAQGVAGVFEAVYTAVAMIEAP